MIVAKYIGGGMGAVASRTVAVPASTPTLGRRGRAPVPLQSSNTGLPGALKPMAPRPVSITTAAMQRAVNASHTLGRRPPSTSAAAAPAAAASISYADAATRSSSSSSSGGGGASTWRAPDVDVARGGPDPSRVPMGDAYVSVSGGIPDGALYAIMAAVVAAGGYALWRRSRRQ